MKEAPRSQDVSLSLKVQITTPLTFDSIADLVKSDRHASTNQSHTELKVQVGFAVEVEGLILGLEITWTLDV